MTGRPGRDEQRGQASAPPRSGYRTPPKHIAPMSRRILSKVVAGFCTSFCALFFSFSASGLTVTRGPYLQISTPSSIVVRWRTDVATDSRVSYGPAQGKLTSQVDQTTSTTEHELQLTGLTPGARYYYSMATGVKTAMGPI